VTVYDPNPLMTPYKLGRPVLTGSGVPGAFDSHAVDCPFVFHHNGTFHMMHVGFDGKGYQTGLATSGDLIHWRHKGVLLGREGSQSWDRVGAAGTWIIRDNGLYGRPALRKIDGRYWMVYHSYPGEGYEQGPGEMGLAWTEDEELLSWHRLPGPVYSWREGADWEKGGLYKACLLEHQGLFHLFYNAKNRPGGSWIEQTGLAVSRDLKSWRRHADNPVIRVTDGALYHFYCACRRFHDGDTARNLGDELRCITVATSRPVA